MKKIAIVQQGVWKSRLHSLPLAAGYLKAFAELDPLISANCEIVIYSFSGSDSTLSMTNDVLLDSVPDVVCFSVLGWNYNRFKRVSEVFKQLNPDGWVIFGGNHVSHQGQRVLREAPEVDLVVNGEGEITFQELLRVYLEGRTVDQLSGVRGISFRDSAGAILMTPDRERIRDLDTIPSPILSGAVSLLDDNNVFRYDVGLMETNRGCPYTCAFCYWGGAIGQKVRKFSRSRLRQEVELYAQLGVRDIVLCDANFGMLRQDLEFVEDIIEIRSRYEFPQNLETCWAKNKSKLFYEIVRKMKDAGLRSSFTLSLQTLNAEALELMGRKNMRLNEWEDLAAWLKNEGMECYAELIWGCPGETYDTFVKGYDRLAKTVYRIATYPHLLMPNTEYVTRRKELGIKSIRGDHDDFEYVLSHSTMSVEENRRMLRFLFWARVVAEYMLLRNFWLPLRLLDIPQSHVLKSLDEWVDRQNDTVAKGLKDCRELVVDNLDLSLTSEGVRFVAAECGVSQFFWCWWIDEFQQRVPANYRPALSDILRFDLETRPIFDPPESSSLVPPEQSVVHGVRYYIRRGVDFDHDVERLLEAISKDSHIDVRPKKCTIDLYFRTGFVHFVDNHEFYSQYVGQTADQLIKSTIHTASTTSDYAEALDPTKIVARR